MTLDLRTLSHDDVARRMEKTALYLAQQHVPSAVHSAKLAHAILDEIVEILAPGIRESEVKAYALECFARHGITRTWHPPYVRFGEHTLLTFLDGPGEDRTLGTNDIAFVDIGIVAGDIEGDAGRTVVIGHDSVFTHLAQSSQMIFAQARDYWQAYNPTGIALYEYIYAQAQAMQVQWNLDPAGHLIGAFPHRGWKRGINHFPETIENGKWILEIQIRHPQLPYGAFFEDLLYRDGATTSLTEPVIAG